MRNFIIVGTTTLVVFGAIIAFAYQGEAVTNPLSEPCGAEARLLKANISLGPIQTIRHEGNDVIIDVDRQYWLTIQRHLQVGLGMAAYCGVALENKGGSAIVLDQSADEMGRVAGGKWTSRYGE